MIRRISIAVALLAVLAVQCPAQAQWGCGYGGYGMNYFGSGLPVGWYTGVQGRMPPYFALHPPVYYSGQIVRIPYGCSPFANPWGLPCDAPAASAPVVPAAESIVIAPAAELVTIENPFYKREVEAALPAPKSNPAVQRSQVSNEQGRVIDNPYYQPGPQLANNE